MYLINNYEPAQADEGVCIHEDEDLESLLVREAVEPNRVIVLQAALVHSLQSKKYV